MDGVHSPRQLDLLLSRATDLLCRQRHLRSMGWGRQGNFGMLRTRIEGGAVLRSGSSMSLGYPSCSYSLTRMTSCPLFSRLTLGPVFGRDRSVVGRVKTNVGGGRGGASLETAGIRNFQSMAHQTLLCPLPSYLSSYGFG